MELTVPEAARRAGRSRETVRRWIWSGRLPSRKVGNQHLVDSEAVDALIGAKPPAEEQVAEVPGVWGGWLREARSVQDALCAKGVKLPPASELVRASRQGH